MKSKTSTANKTNRNYRRKGILGVVCTATVLALPTISVFAVNSGTPVNMYRMYNPNSGEHFYTANDQERLNLISSGWDYEGAGWVAPEKSDTPVYRLYNQNAGDHFYTMNATEKDNLVKAGWSDEGIGWYSDDEKTIPILREYNKNATVGSHNYTPSAAEDGNLVNGGWASEGVAFYGRPTSEAPAAPAPVIHSATASTSDATNTTTAKTTVYKGVDYKDVYNYDYYTQHNSDVVAAVGTDPNAVIAHFVNTGMSEMRQGSEEFNCEYYIANDPDLAVEYRYDYPSYYRHYMSTGKAEGRHADHLTRTGKLVEEDKVNNRNDIVISSVMHSGGIADYTQE